MRNLKKFLALVLAMMMALSMVVTANAASWNSAGGPFDDNKDVTPAFDEGVSVVTGMKIFEGDNNGDFRPAAYITRAEAAAVVYRLATGDVKDKDGKDDSYLYTHVAPFYDVTPDKWYAGYVGYLWNAEIIKGANDERTAFNPSENVTGYEVLAMVLRAMGYDQNDEFTGPGWQIRVGQTARERNLLDKVDTTNYGAGHLNAAARRDTIAEIVFQAATKATVVYTPAFGYQTGNVDAGLKNPTSSLGRANFGLVSDHGIVVGNQATGETVTKMGIATRVYTDGTYTTGTITNDSYNYAGLGVADSTNNKTNVDHDDYVEGTTTVGSVTQSFDHDTPLTQFGHANKVWYDINANSGGVGKYHTYAWFDEATEAKTVYTRDDVAAGDLNNANSRLAEVAETAGFTIRTTTDGTNLIAFGSDKYDRMAPLFGAASNNDKRIETAGDKDDVASPAIHMYSLISNSPNKALDVVISLDAEVARIYDTNTTASKDRLVLLEATLGGETTRNTSGYGEILVENLTKDSVQTLNTNVEAWVVDGTATVNPVPNRDLASHYETIAVKQGPSGLVSTIDDTTGTIYLADGTKLEKSYLYDVVMPGSVTQEGITAGVTLSFVVDQWGRYLGLSSDPGYTFIYATYADHDYGAVGSADMKYVVTGVDSNGQRIANHELTQMWKTDDDAAFKALNGTVYGSIETAKRNFGAPALGNQIDPGVYRAGVITTDGKWLVNSDDSNGDGYRNIYSVADKNGANWSFTAADVANGFVDVSATPGDGDLLLTPNTEFYVVSGTGIGTTNTQTVKKYVGIKDFLDGASSVTIDVKYQDLDSTGTPITADTTLTYDVAYMTSADIYHSVGNLNDNYMITKVFVYEDAVSRTNTATLFYAHSGQPTTLEIAGYEDDYDQYEFWQGSTKVNYFIDSSNTINPDKFYTLVKAPNKVNGLDVYTATEVTSAGVNGHVDANRAAVPGGDCWSTETFDYYATNNTSTARIGGTGADNIYRVDNVGAVVDLTVLARHDSAAEAATHVSHDEIKSVNDLFNATSVGYDVTVSIVNDGVNVSTIYVVGITKP